MAQTSYAMPNQQIPGEIYQMAAINGLGDLLALYKPKYTNPLLIIGITVAAIILDIIAIIVVYNLGRISFYLIAIPIIVLIWAFNALPNANLRIYMFTYGFINAKGPQGDAVRWDQVMAIWEKSSQSRYSTSYTYTVQRADGRIFKQGTPLQKSKDMGVQMMREIVKIHLPRARAAFDVGQNLPFGILNLNRQGLNNGKEMIPWDQIGQVTTKKGIVCIEKNGRTIKWSSVKSADIPNLVVLMALVNQLVQGQR